MNTSGATAYEIVTQVFVDITADYRLRFPRAVAERPGARPSAG